MLLPIFAVLQPEIAANSNEPGAGAPQLSANTCEPQGVTADEIVVCGRRGDRSPYRISPQASPPSALPDAEFRLSDGVGVKVHAQQGEVGGIPTNRGLISLKLRF